MKFAAILVVTLALASSAFAVLRPRFPLKPSPPYQGRVIVIEDDSIKTPSENSPALGAN